MKILHSNLPNVPEKNFLITTKKPNHSYILETCQILNLSQYQPTTGNKLQPNFTQPIVYSPYSNELAPNLFFFVSYQEEQYEANFLHKANFFVQLSFLCNLLPFGIISLPSNHLFLCTSHTNIKSTMLSIQFKQTNQ